MRLERVFKLPAVTWLKKQGLRFDWQLLFVLLLGITLSCAGAWWTYDETLNDGQEDVSLASIRAHDEIIWRFELVMGNLTAMKSVYSQSPELSRQGFAAAIADLEPNFERHGIKALGFMQRVPRPNLPAFIAAERAAGDANFSVRELEKERHEELYVVKVVGPTHHNAAALGMEPGFEGGFRDATELAVSSGKPSLASRQPSTYSRTPDLLIFVPVFKRAMPLSTVAERRMALLGVLFASVNPDQLLAGITAHLPEGTDIELIDGPAIEPKTVLLYDADKHRGIPPITPNFNTRDYFQDHQRLTLFDRPMLVYARSPHRFVGSLNDFLPWLALLTGLFITWQLSRVYWQRQESSKQSARKLDAIAAELSEKDELVDGIFEMSPLAIALCDLGGKLISSNPAFQRMFGYSPQEVKELDYWKLSPELDNAFDARLLGSRTDHFGPYEKAFLHKDGDLIPIALNGMRLTGADDQQYICFLIEDITERKRAQIDQQNAQNMLRSAIETIGEAFALFDTKDRLVLFNQQFKDCYPLCADMIVPGNTFEQIVRAGAERGQFEQAIGRVNDWVEEKLALHRQPASDATQRLTDGRVLRIIERKTPDGYTVGVRSDITQLVLATEAANQATRAKSEFLATMSHEIRTPMNAVLGLLQLLALTELSSQQTDYIQKTRQAAHSMLQLLNDILDISRLESDKTALEVQPFALDDLMRELSTLLSTQLEDKRIELLFDIDTAIPKLLIGDVLRLKQILFNLGNNAVKFTQQGDVLIQIRMLSRTPGQVVLSFAVSDTGIGIAPENQQSIFSAFSQAESSITRRFGGTGLGLSISRKLVELMGGKIELSSVLGQGSTFSISVPLQIPAQDSTERKVENMTARETLQVLLVENHPKACQLEQAMAQSLGLQTDTASTGTQALALIEARRQSGQAPYQLVLMDEDMSDMDGWQASQRIREISAPKRPPLIIMLARSPRQALSRRKEPELALLSAYLVKPITAGMLADALASARKGDRTLRNQPRETGLKPKRLQGLRLLVAEDNPLNQRVMQELFRTEGAEVELADNGELAVAAIVHAKQPFDAVLMDIQMPVMDGYGATSVIRKELGLTELPIIALSANNSLADRQACLSAGMDDHIGKPFDMTQLVQVILNHTGRASEAGNLPPAAPVAPESAEHPVILDISVLDRLSGNPAMLRELLESYLKEISNAPDQLQARLDQGDFTGAAHLSHTLIGISAIVGAKHMAAVARLTQGQLKNNPVPTELAALCSAFREAATLTHSTLLPVVQNLS